MDTADEFLSRFPPLPPSLLAGVSGGADSVALLLLLDRWRIMAGDRKLYAVHVDHGLRGQDSDEDALFVKELCTRLDVPLLVFHAVPPAHPSEDWARQARYSFFRQAMEETGADALCLAHHMDDQAETFMLHLLRGAGPSGLCGMAPDITRGGMRILRPLLSFRREELKQYLLSVSQDWREDASNADTRYLRNAVRHELLPLMESLNAGATEHIASAAALLREDDRLLEQEAAERLGEAVRSRSVPLSLFEDIDPVLRDRMLRRWWQEQAGHAMDEHSLSLAQTQRLVELLSSPARSRELCGGWSALRGRRHLHLIPPEPDPLPSPQPVRDGVRLNGVIVSLQADPPDPGDGRLSQALPVSLIPELSLRVMSPGDWIRPFGHRHTRSLNDYLSHAQVDAPFRTRLPLLCCGSEVLLVCGVGAGDVPRWREQPGPWLRIVWSGSMPWLEDASSR